MPTARVGGERREDDLTVTAERGVVRSDVGASRVGPIVVAVVPVLAVNAQAAEQARAAEEVEGLPEGTVIVRMLSDHAVLRDQARACW